jgi:cobaltochelatase CobS
MAEFREQIQQIDNEILGQKEELVNRLITQQLQKFVFEEKNLSPQLLTLLMAKADYQVPVPERKEIPNEGLDAASDLELLNSETGAIFSDLLVGNNVYLYGKAGTGKTTLAKKIAENLLIQKTYVINCNQFTSPINIIGGQTIEGYKQGLLCEAWEKGGILILDELPKLDPNTAGLLNEALAQSADQETTREITKEKFDRYQAELDSLQDKSTASFEIFEVDDKYYYTQYITITDGKGTRLRKNKKFGVIATGNTNLKEISNNFSGNNRQDYSLVDRFAGSFYEIGFDSKLEQSLTYSLVYQVAIKIREFLMQDADSVESVSLRTMLNFNRIFEQEYLRKIKSPYANPVLKIGGKSLGKTFVESIESFIGTLPATKQVAIRKLDILDLATTEMPLDEFMNEFERIHKTSPKAGQGKKD